MITISKKLKISKPTSLNANKKKKTTLGLPEVTQLKKNNPLTYQKLTTNSDEKDNNDQESLGLTSKKYKNNKKKKLKNELLTHENDSLKHNMNLKYANTFATMSKHNVKIHHIGRILNQLKCNQNAKCINNNYLWVNRKTVENEAQMLNTTSFNNFNLFAMFLYDIFIQKNELRACYNLSLVELHILNAILYKKFHKCLSSEDLNLPFQIILTKICSIIEYSNSKRPEECYKFILLKTMKHLKLKFRAQFKIKRVQLEKFYNYYFGDIAKAKGISLEHFFFPSKSKKVKTKTSLNSAYFSLIFKSNKFVSDLKIYMEYYLYDEYYNDISKKWTQFLSKLFPILKTVKISKICDVSHLVEKLLDSRQLSLPWTLSEVHEAVARVTELIEIYK